MSFGSKNGSLERLRFQKSGSLLNLLCAIESANPGNPVVPVFISFGLEDTSFLVRPTGTCVEQITDRLSTDRINQLAILLHLLVSQCLIHSFCPCANFSSSMLLDAAGIFHLFCDCC